jgi:hypothetical protein
MTGFFIANDVITYNLILLTLLSSLSKNNLIFKINNMFKKIMEIISLNYKDKSLLVISDTSHIITLI